MATISKNIDNQPDSISDTHIVLEDFLRLYSDMEDGQKYEWNNGQIEKTIAMDQTQSVLLADILARLFHSTKTYQKGGVLVAETDMKTSNTQLRRPDLAIYFFEQKPKIAAGENQIAPWIGEIISQSDNINKVLSKMHEYFAAGVKVVWHIFPEHEEVRVYTSPDDVTICRGQKICSGQPALEGFDLPAQAIFAYKKEYL